MRYANHPTHLQQVDFLASFLRLSLSKLSEKDWVNHAKALKTRPPMPWFNLNKWSDSDLRAFY